MKSLWENIDEMSDSLISYNLFKEGKNIHQISKIRNMDNQTIKLHLFEIKKELSYDIQNSDINKDDLNLNFYLSLSKLQRLDFIQKIKDLNKEEKMQSIIADGFININNIEDMMVLIWTVGELNLKIFNDKLKYFCSHPHGNIRRMAFSAMGKIGLEEFLPYLINGLKDKKPQVRQYAVIAFGKVSNEENIERLYKILNDKDEKEYIKRSAKQSIDIIMGISFSGENNEGI